ncbi:MAG: ERCC4 domain-containing protein [Bacteroidales bacterium]
MDEKLKIVADYREVPSKIPEILIEKGIVSELKHLKTGDYIVNEEVLFERKSRDDFVLSIFQNRLFTQCSRMKKSDYHTVLLIEGNPYKTKHDISRQAIRGALLSVSVSWQIPIIFSSNPHDSADMLIMAGKQLIQNNYQYMRKGYKSKRKKSQSLYFLQGLPNVGPSTAYALLEHFGSPENVILASDEELMEIEGVGATKARRIRKFLSQKLK